MRRSPHRQPHTRVHLGVCRGAPRAIGPSRPASRQPARRGGGRQAWVTDRRSSRAGSPSSAAEGGSIGAHCRRPRLPLRPPRRRRGGAVSQIVGHAVPLGEQRPVEAERGELLADQRGQPEPEQCRPTQPRRGRRGAARPCRAAPAWPAASPPAASGDPGTDRGAGGHGRGEGLDFRRAAFDDLHYWFCRQASATI